MLIKIDFNNEYKYREIIDTFPFDKCQSIMSVLDWCYYNTLPYQPSINELKSMLYSLLIKNYYYVSCGGFDVHTKNNKITVSFGFGGHFFLKKSDEWDFDDMSSLNLFMGKVNKVSGLINSPLSFLVTDDELSSFIKRNSDEFIDENIDHKKIFNLHFEREVIEEGDEDLFGYDLSFKCYEMEF